MKNVKLVVNPLFLAAAPFYILTGRTDLYLCCAAAALAHELAHAFFARRAGYVVRRVELLPYGAKLSLDGYPQGKEGAVVAAAGPAFSLSVAVLLIALWWIFPASYNYTMTLCAANLFIAAFNLLPVLPLDGGRIVLCLSKNPMKAAKRMRAAAYIISAVMLILCVISAFFKFNLSIGVTGLFLFYGAAFEQKREEYVRFQRFPDSKKHGAILEKKCFRVPCDAPLSKLLKLLRASYVSVFEVVDRDGKVKARLEESDCETLFLTRRLTDSVDDALGKP